MKCKLTFFFQIYTTILTARRELINFIHHRGTQVSNSNMELVEVEGIFDDLEPEIIRWIFALAMAVNDISYGAKRIREASDYEKIYLFRLGFAHLKEIAKVVGRAQENHIIRKFILNMETEAQNTYRKIEEFLGSYDNDGFVKKVLKSPEMKRFTI